MRKLLLFILILISAAAIGQQSIDVKKATVRQWIIYQGDTLNVIKTSGDTIFLEQGADLDTLITGEVNWTRGTGVLYPKTATDTVRVKANLKLPPSTATTGIIYKNNERFIHNYNATGTNGRNLFVGNLAGNFTLGGATGTNASNNVGIGYAALNKVTNGYENVAVGAFALYQNLAGLGNVAVGHQAMLNANDTTWTGNVGVGWLTMDNADSCNSNNAVGGWALRNVRGSCNEAFGSAALENLRIGWDNIAIGSNSMRKFMSGYSNSSIGTYGFHENLTGNNNVGIGDSVGFYNLGSRNVFLGSNAGRQETGSYKLYIESSAADSNNALIFGNFVTNRLTINGFINLPTTTSATGQILNNGVRAIHFYKPAANNGQNIFVGELAGNFTMTSATAGQSSYNIGIGYGTGYKLTTGYNNIMIGADAGTSVSTGLCNVFTGKSSGLNTSTGSHNIFSGYNSGASNVSGNYNVFLGGTAGEVSTSSENILIGHGTGTSQTTGGNNTEIGFQSGYSNQTGSANIFLGYRAGYKETGSNKLYIANDSTSMTRFTTADGVLIYGDFDNNYINVYNKLAIGIAKSPAYTLDVAGEGYFSDDLWVNDTARFIGEGNILTSGGGALKINTGIGAVSMTGDLTYNFKHFVAYVTGGTYTPNTASNVTFKMLPTFQVSENDGFTFAGDSLTIITAGDYYMDFAGTFQGANGSDWKLSIFKNGVELASGWPVVTTTGAGNYCTWSWPIYWIGLAAGDDLSWHVMNEGGTDDPTFRALKWYIRKEPE